MLARSMRVAALDVQSCRSPSRPVVKQAWPVPYEMGSRGTALTRFQLKSLFT
jgi:hypothetical protein